ncbi:hypothetical protein HMPREF0083_04856 [Aneurinibacillus aneurinilyticus ATCC 12856]|uniref:Uncharacterized protein n=1 Tax=Aneurinibacillus aneurinilyticus ATCC 12856 TaxID=649747 RepID=U1Y890_ANEAE|nr:hypothetical protein HMPREF0083_04856 [Aneurinibacillus aneurinilyticus ATCC 12856]
MTGSEANKHTEEIFCIKDETDGHRLFLSSSSPILNHNTILFVPYK